MTHGFGVRACNGSVIIIGSSSRFSSELLEMIVDMLENLLLDVLLDQIGGHFAVLEPELLVVHPIQIVLDLLLALAHLTSRAEYVHSLAGLVQVHADLRVDLRQVLQIRRLLEEVDLVRLQVCDRLGRCHWSVLQLDVVLRQRVLYEVREHRLWTRTVYFKSNFHISI